MSVSVISWSMVFPWVILVKCNAGRQIHMLLSEIMVGQNIIHCKFKNTY